MQRTQIVDGRPKNCQKFAQEQVTLLRIPFASLWVDTRTALTFPALDTSQGR